MEQLKSYFQELRKHVILLSIEWKFFKDLYFSKNSSDILNQSVPYFFDSLKMILTDGLIIKLAKILDKKNTGSNENLCIAYLLELLENNGLEYEYTSIKYIEYKKEFEKYLCLTESGAFMTKRFYWCDKKPSIKNDYNCLKKLFNELTPYRNKYLAHIDRMDGRKYQELLPHDIDNLLELIIIRLFDIMNKLEILVVKNNTAYSMPILYNDAQKLLSILKKYNTNNTVGGN